MSKSYLFALSVDELIELEDTAQERKSLLARISAAKFVYGRMLPADQAMIRSIIIAMEGKEGCQPLFNRRIDGEQILNYFEFTRRLGLVLESARVAVQSTCEKPRARGDRGGWHPLRLAQPGKRSGAQRNSL